MGRRPEVFVRQVSMAEGQRLQRITRTAKDPVKLRRGQRLPQRGVDVDVGGAVLDHVTVEPGRQRVEPRVHPAAA